MVKPLTLTRVSLPRHVSAECSRFAGDADDLTRCRLQSVKHGFSLNRVAKVHVTLQVLTRSGHWRRTTSLVVTRRAGQHVVTLVQGWFTAGSYRLVIQATTAQRHSPAVAERLLVLVPTSAPDTD